jgi:hypothetical protein
MQPFKSACSAQKLLSTHTAVHNTFTVKCHFTLAQPPRVLRAAAISTWGEVVAAARRSVTPRLQSARLFT